MRANKFVMSLKRKLPTILGIVSTFSTLAALYFTGKATADVVRDYDSLKASGVELTRKEMLKRYVPYYIPAIGFTTVSIGCNIASNTIHAKQKRMLSLATSSAVDALRDLKAKAKQVVGEEKLREIETEYAKDQKLLTQNTDPSEKRIRVYDEFTKTKFTTTMEKLKDAEAEVNRQINSICWGKCQMELRDFYRLMGVDISKTKSILNSNYIWSQEYMLDQWELSYVDFFDKEKAPDLDGEEMIILRYFPQPEEEFKIKEYYASM